MPSKYAGLWRELCTFAVLCALNFEEDNKMICEYTEILNELKRKIAELASRRPSAGRSHYLMSIMDDIEELAGKFRADILEKVSRDIVLDVDDGIDYTAQSESVRALLPVELKGQSAEEQMVCRNLEEKIDELGNVLSQIAANLVRRHSHDEFARLYENEKRRYLNSGTAGRARQTFEDWRVYQCFGEPTLEDIEDYRLEKMLNMFDKGALASMSKHVKHIKRFSNEVDFDQLDEEPERKKHFYKSYTALRRMTDWKDGYLVALPDRIGQYFYVSSHDENAKSHRSSLLKYLHKIDMVQQERRKLLAAQAEREMRQVESDQLNYFAPSKILKMLLCQEWFSMLTIDDKRYNQKWVHGFVDALMASEWREQIAGDWAVREKRLMLQCMIIGALKDAGVIKGSYSAIAKLLDIDGENPATLAKYIGMGKKQPFAEWINNYVSS